jgi:CDGSH-type Zn-finger protein/uncharacterized Fe-S cluster protein YjdI
MSSRDLHLTRRTVIGSAMAAAVTPTAGRANVTDVSGDKPPKAPASDTGPPAGRSGIGIARGRDITIRYDDKRCIHARFCVLWQPNVYRTGVKPWIVPDADDVNASVAIIHNCPSGALQYERHDGGPPEPPPRTNLVYVQENGPLALRAQFTLDGRSVGYRATLCRCGASKNKPFCDGSHKKTGFVASGEPATIDSQPLGARDGEVAVTQVRNGPLNMRGNLEICSGTGRTVLRTAEASFCRCGQSANKPFCDGSHVWSGFSTD